jgi:aerobic-type carbon monoxide dehydrogenase small subunit (CoxS/CutS family)
MSGNPQEPVALRINGIEHRLRLDPRTTLLDCLRETVFLTGTKKGCAWRAPGLPRSCCRTSAR